MVLGGSRYGKCARSKSRQLYCSCAENTTPKWTVHGRTTSSHHWWPGFLMIPEVRMCTPLAHWLGMLQQRLELEQLPTCSIVCDCISLIVAGARFKVWDLANWRTYRPAGTVIIRSENRGGPSEDTGWPHSRICNMAHCTLLVLVNWHGGAQQAC